MRLLRRGRTLCNPRSPDRSHNTERELSLGSTHAGRHAFGFTVLRRRFPVEFLKHAIELRERLKPHCKRDFTDAQITVSQEITRVLEPSVRDVVDKLYAGYLFEILAQIIRVHVDHFATLVRESSSRVCSSIYLRAFQIATGSARFREVALSISAASLSSSCNHLIVAE
jgi:hypothetical protein